MPDDLASVKMYTLPEAVAYLKRDRRTISRYVEAGELRATRMGNRLRFAKEDLEAFMRNGTSEKYWSTAQQKKDDRLAKELSAVDEALASVRSTVNGVAVSPVVRQRIMGAVAKTEKALAELKKAMLD